MLNIKSLIENGEFIRLADKYVPYITDRDSISYEKILTDKFKKLNFNELKIPVLGMQGTGKSSLLNALLFNDGVLPFDANETTCIPVEIKYHSDTAIEIKIFFLDGKETILEDYKELKQYVNNDYNPANEKNVEKVIIQCNSNILKNEIVLVDLPGVGSLTQQNEKVTMNYVENMSYGIFLLKTVPPITKPDLFFLKLVWPILLEALFIQNRWDDESISEVNEGKEHNLKMLKEIAIVKNTSDDVKISVVNIYLAYKGATKDNQNMISQSGIETVKSFLISLGENWKERLSILFTDNLKNISENIKTKIHELTINSELSIDELKEKLSEEEKRFLKKVKSNKKIISQIRNKINIHQADLNNFVNKRSRNAKENLRNAMRNVISGGVVDGSNLSRAFNDNQDKQWKEVNEDIMLKFEEIQRDIQIEIDDLEIKTIKGDFKKYSLFNKEKSFKFEKGIPYSTSIAGSIGGVIVGGKVGAELGASLGTVFGPGVGTAIGGVVGFIAGTGIALISSWLGLKTKDAVSKTRQVDSLKDLEGPLNDFENYLNETLSEISSDLMSYLENNITRFEDSEMNNLEHDKAENKKVLELDHNERKNQKLELQSDLKSIASIMEELNG
jgi:hypothetical protein